jgi:hypothetical protein
MKKKIFWLDEAFYKGPIGNKFQGGYYFRAFDLIKFMKLVEKEEGEVVGLCFEDNNVDIIIKDNGETER